MKPSSKVTPVVGKGALKPSSSKVVKRKTPAKDSRSKRRLESLTTPPAAKTLKSSKLNLDSGEKRKQRRRSDPEIEALIKELGWEQKDSDTDHRDTDSSLGEDSDEEFCEKVQNPDITSSGGEMDDELDEMLQNSEKKISHARSKESSVRVEEPTMSSRSTPKSSTTMPTPQVALQKPQEQEKVELQFQKSLENLSHGVALELKHMERRNEERHEEVLQKIEEVGERILARKAPGRTDKDERLQKPYKDAVHEVYANLGPQMKYHDERFDSPHNQRVTRMIKETIHEGFQNLPDAAMLHKACRRRCESITRPKMSPTEKAAKNMHMRRLTKFERRGKAKMTEKEAMYWEGASPDYMTDEEEDEDENHNKIFLERPLPWRSATFARLVKLLDARIPPVNVNARRLGEPSERPAPAGCPEKFLVRGQGQS